MLKNKYNLFAIAAIFILISILAATNWRPDTFLTGWDNLHPEFNFGAHIKRAIFGTWQEYQGLGTVSGMGLAADLPRQVFLFLLSFVLPRELLRYFFHFFMLFVGTVGAYFVVKEVILYNLDEKRGSLAGFVGAIFYLFNLATLQMFYVPFEPFSAHFGFLPWLLFANVHFFRMKDKKSLAFLLLVNILAIPQNSVATFFYVYLLTLLFFLGIAWHLQRRLKEVFIALFLLISVNAFWLFPNMYYVVEKANEHVNAKVNLMATEDSFLLNKKYGNLENTMLMKGFWFDNKQTDVNGKAQYQMGIWRDHLENPLIKTAGYSLFFLCVVGIYFAFKKRVWGAMFFSPMLLFAFTIISNDTPVFAQIAGLFYKLPLFSQVFRFPFTKFAILTVFMLSFYFAICFAQIYRYAKQRWLKYLIFGLFVGLPIFFCYPMFLGKLFYYRNRIKIPQEYFQVFDFFKKQNKNERIANLPQHQYWEWTFYRWDYQGAGILWNGIEQPTLDRAFDVWGKENENYYHEISYSVYSGNVQLFRKILDKYQVRWLLLDRSVINPNSAKAAYSEKLEEMIRQFADIQLVQTFGNVGIYRVNTNENPQNYVFLLKNAPSVAPTYQWNNNDTAYSELGDYYAIDSGKTTAGSFVYYPFRSLFTGRRDEDREFIVEDKGDYYSFKTTLSKELTGGELLISPIEQDEVTEVNENDLSTAINKTPSIYLDGELVPFDNKAPQAVKLSYISQGNLEIRVPKIRGFYSYTSDGKTLEPQLCDEEGKGEVSAETFAENGTNIIRLQSLNSKNCVAISLPGLSNRIAYLTSITTRHVEGKPLLFWWENLNARRGDVENYLRKDTTFHQEYYLQPPMEQYGLGYTLHFDNASIGRVETVNDLGKITVNPIPYRFLTSLKIVNGNGAIEKAQVTTEGLSVFHPNPSFYQVSINRQQITDNNQQKTTLVGDSLIGGSEMIRFSGPSNSFNISNRNNFVNSSFSKSGPQGNRTPGTLFEGPDPNHSRPTRKPSYQETNKIVNQVLAADSSDYSTLEESYSVALSTIGGVMASPAQPATPEVYLTLSQSFDKGWKAYQVSCQLSAISCQLKNLLPFLFFEEIKDHVMVNNWENGWRLGNQLSVFSNQQDKNKPKTDDRPRKASPRGKQPTITIAIVYLPQYLEYLGFGLLGLLPIILLKISKK